MRISLTPDGRLLFLTRTLRLFAYGLLSVILVLYLAERGISKEKIGLLLSFTLLGDAVISLWITTQADRIGRKRMLIIGAGLIILGGTLFALPVGFPLLLLGATIGVISPSGGEVGPFLSIEQASLSQTITNEERTHIFAWYNLVGSAATALGALIAGLFIQTLQNAHVATLVSYQALTIGYAAIGIALALLFTRLSPASEAPRRDSSTLRSRFGLHKSKGVALKLSGFFALDAFGGGFVLQTVVAYWFTVRFGVHPALLGGIFFWANLFAGFSGLLAARLASRFGLLNTMVFTHLPSNALLILVPLMPTLPLAIALLLLRFSISQMDVPTRQSYIMAVVAPDERSAAAGIAGVARTLGASLSPLLVGPLLANPALLSVPFFLAGGVKIVYDLLLYMSARHTRLE